MLRLFCLALLLLAVACSDQINTIVENRTIPGLKSVVEIYRDAWGTNHIYADNTHDLFFSQGYAAAQDRLFQFEIWRRQATGTVAEILGAEELNRDIGTRMFQFRGDMQKELNHYHEDGEKIINAFVAGVNTYIDIINQTPEALPLPFKMLGIKPKKWTPEVVISRHQGLLGNIDLELEVGRAVAEIGPKKVKKLLWFHPKDPILNLDKKIEADLLFDDILAPYFAFRKPIEFKSEHLLAAYRSGKEITGLNHYNDLTATDLNVGSNNWVIAAEKSVSGSTLMANDPHRSIAVPSLRYMAHLVAPGWNVIGGGEPEIPGISIGHNEYGAWGLTVFRTDGEDLLQYQLNPENPLQYKYDGVWKNFTVITETIAIKGQPSQKVNLYFSHHGPVTYINKKRNIAYAVRCAWLEPGGSPYLASLRMDQAKDWNAFRQACSYSNIPGENMVWADKTGVIGWQTVGIAPIRKNFSGLVPVPGDGSYEWEGFLPILEKPYQVNSEKGFIATANQNVTPNTYSNWDAIGYSWSDPYRGERIDEVLSEDKKFTLEEMKSLQTDVFSIPARTLVPYLKNLPFREKEGKLCQQLLNWDFRLTEKSIEATIYVAWEKELLETAKTQFFPKNLKANISPQLKRVIDWIIDPKIIFGSIKKRDSFVKSTFEQAVQTTIQRLGDNPEQWRYGQLNNKHVALTHPLGNISNAAIAQQLNLQPLPRSGNGYTPNSTGNSLNQIKGASFRMIVDTGNWDLCIGTNTPGQSGDPKSPFFKNLYKPWVENIYFPLYFSKQKIQEVAYKRTSLIPSK